MSKEYINRSELLELYRNDELDLSGTCVPIEVVIQNIKDIPAVNVVEKEELVEMIKFSINAVKMIKFSINASDVKSDYFIGLRNGLRLALSFIDGNDPKFEHLNEELSTSN